MNIAILFRNICALVYGYSEYKNDDICPDQNDVCSIDCVDDGKYIIDPSLYLQVAGFSMLISSLLSICTHCFVCPPEPGYTHIPSGKQLIFRFMVVIYSIVWSSIGIHLYTQLINECKDTPKGKMLLSWVIITLSNGSLRCCGVCSKMSIRRQINSGNLN